MSGPASTVAAIWTTGTTEGTRTGTWRSALPRHVQAPSPCHQACPVDGEIAQWIAQARAGDFHGAWQTLTRHNPFPAITGRVCHHPCEAACNRGAYDDALAICKLERHVGDLALAAGWHFEPPARELGHRVAVVGGGPAGLSAAYQLRRLGHAVTLFEARAELGGVMRHGIPAYRLPRAVLDGEIARIVALGLELRCNESPDTPQALDALRRDFDAVLLATGAGRTRALSQLDATRPWTMDGARYLAATNGGAAPALGPRVVVVGGGSAAIDVARSARRAGHDVSVLCLEPEAAMPAQREEVVEALEEGVRLVDASMLRQVLELGGAGLRLQCQRVRLEPTGARGRFHVHALEGSVFELPADAVITSIGQDPVLDGLGQGLGTFDGLLAVDAQGRTSATGVWAAGDVAALERFVSEAVGRAKRTAQAIDQALRGLPQAAPDAATDAARDVVTLGRINLFEHPHQARAVEPRLTPNARLGGVAEVQQGLTPEAVQREAERCFSCGRCTHCDNCVAYCPDMAVQHLGEGYTVLGDYCKGCGLCVRECPTGSLILEPEAR